MFCKFCGEKNPDEAVFCKKCGKKIKDEIALSDVENNKVQKTEISNTSTIFGVSCPQCSAGSEFCHPVVKTNVKVTGKFYDICDGCCGYILLGPVGLLCGACGSSVKTKTRNETWWICQRCGKEFMSKQSALERANVSMWMAALYTLLIGSCIGHGIEEPGDFWFDAILVLIIVGLWISIVKSFEDRTGRKLNDLLTYDESHLFWLKYSAICAGSITLGLLWGINTIG
ncbi:zinc-ribbon domain-containing protein [Anaerotignum sp. MSJ-24]|uniref:zinc-ribbon domain-containing protein n=1 Tax=Anaerotignum sp. MSJ-24 TaxID=2841521 RepID=UPI001C1151FE|nr:zinc-ribbon domain-containing protein [Anaerotignum sp. MSJ-24]MBU5465055.1 zinc-ribbon domain-containing protein [Anaerotignum sp. MSJ-24]